MSPTSNSRRRTPDARPLTVPKEVARDIVKYCRACGSPDSRFLFEIQQRRVHRCEECTHVYLDVVHSSDSIRHLYAHYGSSGQSQYFAGIDEQVKRNLDGYLARCKVLLRGRVEQPRLLDVGCGNGVLLSRARACGFQITGTEISAPLAAQASQRLGCTVHRQFLTELAFPDASFDVVTMYDLIEHLQDPRSDLEQVFRIVKPGGVFFILTPNDEAFLRRISKMLYRLSFHSFDEPMRRLYYPDHLSYFTAESLSQLLCRAGFELVSLESVNQELSRLELSPLQKLVVKVILQIGRPFRSSGGKLVAYARKP
jgi:2-polyprenyl-3-methyl-5-hydroxy-6-metoxy-1,4-benzoquinol methylase